MIVQPKHSIAKYIYLLLLPVLLTGCTKAGISPTTEVKTIAAKAVDTIKKTTYSAETDTSNPDYWFNGTKGTALVRVTCKECTAIATIGNDTTPFLFNADGVGYLKYTPKSGLSIHIAVCPGTSKAIKADILDAKNASLYTYSGVISTNWGDTFVIK